MGETLYDILKIREDAPPELIRAAYKTLSSMHHPDKNPDDLTASEAMKRINSAYRILRDPESRARYDKALQKMRAVESMPRWQSHTTGDDMKRLVIRHLALSALLLLPFTAQAQNVYKCPDAKGRIQFTDQPCSGSLNANRVKVQANSLDASHARGLVDRQRNEREQQQYSSAPNLANETRTTPQTRSSADVDCKLAIRNADVQSQHAKPQKIDADRAQARGVCGFDPWPGKSMTEIDAENRRAEALRKEQNRPRMCTGIGGGMAICN